MPLMTSLDRKFSHVRAKFTRAVVALLRFRSGGAAGDLVDTAMSRSQRNGGRETGRNARHVCKATPTRVIDAGGNAKAAEIASFCASANLSALNGKTAAAIGAMLRKILIITTTRSKRRTFFEGLQAAL